MRSGIFQTPEAAALDGFPDVHCRVVASATGGDDAYVVLDTGLAGHPYLYGVCVERQDGGWVGGGSGNGDGWTLTDTESGLGTATAWGEAPEGADAVRVSFRGDVRDVPVDDGVYLAAWWRAGPDDDLPRVDAFRIGGRWVPEPAER